MEIATPTYDDTWGIEELLMLYQEEVIATNPEIFFAGLDREKVTSAVVNGMDDDSVHIVVARKDGHVIGMMRAIENVHFFTQVVAVNMDMIFVAPAVRGSLLGGRVFKRLVEEFENWGSDRGAQILLISSLSGLQYQRMNKMIEKFGYKTTGFHSLKRIGV